MTEEYKEYQTKSRLTVDDMDTVAYSPWELCGMMQFCTKRYDEPGGCLNGCKVFEVYKKLAMYENMDNGKMTTFEFLPGEYVYEANFDRNIVSEYEIASVRYGINKTPHYIWVLRKGIYSDLDGFHNKDIGVKIFHTYEEAELALKKP